MKKQIESQSLGYQLFSSLAHLSERIHQKRLLQVSSIQHSAKSSSNGPSQVKKLRLGPKITETVKRKLSFGAKILKRGGVDNIFKHHFSMVEGEKLIKTSQCYLSTTAGPIPGLLFISSQKVAFCSERPIKFSSPAGVVLRTNYKVVIPIKNICRANESQNFLRPSRKYIEIVTSDDFEFWFLGFMNHKKCLKYLQQAVLQRVQ